MIDILFGQEDVDKLISEYGKEELKEAIDRCEESHWYGIYTDV